ncbi:MAG: phenylacetate--CoA ligase family protein [Proteobacteria bacterium]|nr:phenylacetate--CoA ligase family protein [Pseudomonadota bacterium]
MEDIHDIPALISAVPDMVWPGMPGKDGIYVLSLLQQLEHTQYWPAEKLRAMQFRQLETLLRQAWRSTPFYRERLNSLTLDGRFRMTEDILREIPVLTREDIQSAGPALNSTRLRREHGKTSVLKSSGSTGKPVEVLTTGLAGTFWKAFSIRGHFWHQRDLSKKVAAIRKLEDGKALYPKGGLSNFWSPDLKGLYPTGPCAVLNITTPLEQQAEWLQRQKAQYLSSVPTNIFALARHCIEHKIKLPDLMEVRTLGEALRPELRNLCREAWGVEVVDLYSCQEIGHIALQCPDHEHYHVHAERILLEILDEQGNSLGPGKMGRVVITDLHNFATPLIRYEVGDIGELGEPCSCGRTLPVLKRVLGRFRNMLLMPSGGLKYPIFGYDGYTDIIPIKQFQFVQKTLDMIEVRLVTERRMDMAEETRFGDLIRKRLAHPFHVTFSYHEEIPRSVSGKFEDFVSEVNTAFADKPTAG